VGRDREEDFILRFERAGRCARARLSVQSRISGLVSGSLANPAIPVPANPPIPHGGEPHRRETERRIGRQRVTQADCSRMSPRWQNCLTQHWKWFLLLSEFRARRAARSCLQCMYLDALGESFSLGESLGEPFG